MKILLVSLVGMCFLLAPAFASDENTDGTQREVIGHGHAMQTCDAYTFQSCQMMLQQQANNDGARDAEWQCRLAGGHLESPYVQCSNFCNPMMPPSYQQPPVFTTCDSTCYATCLDAR